MTFTIAIPVYNQSDTLAEAIESALKQTVPCEVIVVNDGSTDQTKFVLDEYVDRVKVITQINKGLPNARNTAIMNAAGDWFLPLDSDDVLEPNCVERLMQVIEEMNGEVDIVAPSFRVFGSQQQDVLLMMRPTIEDFKSGNRVGYCSAIRLATLKEVGGYSSRMTWGFEDYALWFNLLRLGKRLVTVPEFLWRYRSRPGSMIETANQHAQELMSQIAKDNPGIF